LSMLTEALPLRVSPPDPSPDPNPNPNANPIYRGAALEGLAFFRPSLGRVRVRVRVRVRARASPGLGLGIGVG